MTSASARDPRGIILARNSFWIALDMTSSLLGGLVASVAVARALGPEKLGHYAYIMWIANTTRVLAGSGLGAAVRKYVAELMGQNDAGTAVTLVRQAIRWQVWAGTAIQVVALLTVIALVKREHLAFAILGVLSILPSLLLGVWAGAVEATQDYAANVRSSMIGNLTNLTGVMLTLLRGWELPGLAASLLTARTVDAVLRYGIYRRLYANAPTGAATELSVSLRRRIRGFGAQVTLLAGLNAILWERSEVFFLQRRGDIRDVAFYSVAFGLVQYMLMVPQTFAQAAGTNLLVEQGRDPSSLGRVASVVVRYLALAAFPLCWGFAALCSAVIHLLYGAAYEPAVPALAVLAGGGVFVAFLPSAQHLLMATERQGVLLRWTVLVAVLNLSLDLLLIPRGGALGAAVANTMSQTLAVLGMWLYIWRGLRIRLPFAAIGRIALVALAAVVPAAVCAARLPPVIAIPLGIATSAVVYFGLVRIMRLLDSEDRERLLDLGRLLPSWLRPALSGMVRLLAG